MTKSIPEGWHSVTPQLVVEDTALQVEFLKKKAFGATGAFEPSEPALVFLCAPPRRPRRPLRLIRRETILPQMNRASQMPQRISEGTA